MSTQPLTQLEFAPADFPIAHKIARALGYEQYVYTSTSALCGLFCLKENPATWLGARQALTAGCIIKTRELGLLFVQGLEDLNLDKQGRRQK